MYSVFDAHAHIYPEKISNKAVENLGSFYNIKISEKGTYADLEKTSNEGKNYQCAVFYFSMWLQIRLRSDELMPLLQKR